MIDLPRRDDDPGDLSVVDLLSTETSFAAAVVVLSACELAVGARGDDDEGVGIPRALLEKGVGTVIAPLWRINDDPEMQQLMQRLHAELARGAAPAVALASVQRDAIRHSLNPRQWAALIAIGS